MKMKQAANRYLMGSVALVAVLSALTGVGICLWGNPETMTLPLVVTAVFQLVACLVYGLVWQMVAQSSSASLPTFYLAASGTRMFAAVVVVMGDLFLVDDKASVRFFVILFLAFYFLILIYDTIYFICVEKKINH